MGHDVDEDVAELDVSGGFEGGADFYSEIGDAVEDPRRLEKLPYVGLIVE